VGTVGDKYMIDPNREYTYAELLELAKEYWTDYYLEMGLEESRAEEQAEKTVLRMAERAKIIRIINPFNPPDDIEIPEKTTILRGEILGAPPTGNTMNGGPTSWSWAVATCSVSTCPQGGPTSWIWGLLVGTVTIPIGSPTSWDWTSVCCDSCELTCQDTCAQSTCQIETCGQSTCQVETCAQSSCQVETCGQSTCQTEGCMQSTCQTDGILVSSIMPGMSNWVFPIHMSNFMSNGL